MAPCCRAAPPSAGAAPPPTPTTDQRGFTRNTSTATDIGAFQSIPLVVNTTADAAATLDAHLRGAVDLANPARAPDDHLRPDRLRHHAADDHAGRGRARRSSKTTVLTGSETIEGPGADLLTVSGNNTSEVFNIAADTVVSMSGLSIIDGNGIFGGGLFNEGTLTITNTTFTGNSAPYGGAIYTRAWGAIPWTVS